MLWLEYSIFWPRKSPLWILFGNISQIFRKCVDHVLKVSSSSFCCSYCSIFHDSELTATKWCQTVALHFQFDEKFPNRLLEQVVGEKDRCRAIVIVVVGTIYDFHNSTDIFVNALFLPFCTQIAPWISSKNRYLDAKSCVWPFWIQN